MTSDPSNAGESNQASNPDKKPEAAHEFLHMFQKGAEFLKEVVSENERLRYRVASLEEAQKNLAEDDGDPRVAHLEEELETWKTKYEDLYSRISDVEDENQGFAQRFLEIEEENNNLANLYIASFQLHSTLDFGEVLQIILEIVINLIGAEIFAVYLLDEKERTLSAVASEGMTADKFPDYTMDEGEVGEVVGGGETALYEDRLGGEVDLHRPLGVIPLKIKDEVIGAISIYKLLEQKTRFTDVDRELFHLLAGHAATAIFAAKLHSESERKLNTMQGFIDLLTKEAP